MVPFNTKLGNDIIRAVRTVDVLFAVFIPGKVDIRMTAGAGFKVVDPAGQCKAVVIIIAASADVVQIVYTKQ